MAERCGQTQTETGLDMFERPWSRPPSGEVCLGLRPSLRLLIWALMLDVRTGLGFAPRCQPCAAAQFSPAHAPPKLGDARASNLKRVPQAVKCAS